jgi:hypothetical protein
MSPHEQLILGVAAMGNSGLKLVGGGGGGDRVGEHHVSTTDSQLLADGLRRYQASTDGQFPQDVARQDLLARIVADELLAQAAPGLSRLIEKARDDLVDCIYVTNLPTEKSITSLLSLALSSAIGKVFNYSSQRGDNLIMEVASDRNSAENPQAELDWHTEGAWLPRECRVEWICLLGLDNTPGIYTAYAPIKPVERTLSAATRKWLYGEFACFREPLGFGLDVNGWSVPRAILSRSPRGDIEIVWPHHAIRAARSDDTVYDGALMELSAEISRHHLQASVDAGCLLAFNNFRGVHMHTPASDGYRLLYKTYARQSLRKLQQMTGQCGPTFALTTAPRQRLLVHAATCQ